MLSGLIKRWDILLQGSFVNINDKSKGKGCITKRMNEHSNLGWDYKDATI